MKIVVFISIFISTPAFAYVNLFSQCASVESEFQQSILNTVEDSYKGFTKVYNCLNSNLNSQRADCATLNKENLNHLKRFRQSIKKLYQEMANRWVLEQSQKRGNYARNCLMNKANQVQLNNHIRTLKPVLSASLCQPILTKWSHGLDRLTFEYLDGKRKSRSLNTKELKALKAFFKSPLKNILPDTALYTQGVSDKRLTKHLAMAYNKMRLGTQKLKDRIKHFTKSEKYKLYDFGNQHQLFVQSLDEGKKRIAKTCKSRSNFSRDCILNVTQYASRCGHRLWAISKEFLPIIPVIDSMGEMGYVRASRISGIMTPMEANTKMARLITMAIFGIGGIVSAVSAPVKIGSRKLRSSVQNITNILGNQQSRMWKTYGSLLKSKSRPEQALIMQTIARLESNGVKSPTIHTRVRNAIGKCNVK